MSFQPKHEWPPVLSEVVPPPPALLFIYHVVYSKVIFNMRAPFRKCCSNTNHRPSDEYDNAHSFTNRNIRFSAVLPQAGPLPNNDIFSQREESVGLIQPVMFCLCDLANINASGLVNDGAPWFCFA